MADATDDTDASAVDPYGSMLTAVPTGQGNQDVTGDVYNAMLGGKYDPNAVAGQLRNQGILGALISSTGNKAVAPVGQQLSDQSSSQLEGLARTRQALAQMQGTQEYRQADLADRQQQNTAENALRQQGLTQQAHEDELNRENQQQMRMLMVNEQREQMGLAPLGPNGQAPAAPGGPALGGDDFLKSLDPGEAATVKGIVEGRQAFPSVSSRSPQAQRLMREIAQYDPTFDFTQPNQRLKANQYFTSGVGGQNVTALNTAIGHLGQLNDQIGGTASTMFPSLNAVLNFGKKETGGAGPTNYANTSAFVANEVPKVLRGSGVAEADIERFMSQLSPNASESQKRSTIKNMIGILQSRANALQSQYQGAMGTGHGQVQFFTPNSQRVMGSILGDDSGGAAAPSGSAAAAPADPLEGRTATGPNGQKMVRRGGQWQPM